MTREGSYDGSYGPKIMYTTDNVTDYDYNTDGTIFASTTHNHSATIVITYKNNKPYQEESWNNGDIGYTQHGRYDENGLKDGVWSYFDNQSQKTTYTTYKHGVVVPN